MLRRFHESVDVNMKNWLYAVGCMGCLLWEIVLVFDFTATTTTTCTTQFYDLYHKNFHTYQTTKHTNATWTIKTTKSTWVSLARQSLCSYSWDNANSWVFIWGHPLSTYAKFSEKLTFPTPWYAHVRVRIRGLEILAFRKILRTYLIDDPYSNFGINLQHKQLNLATICAAIQRNNLYMAR